MLVRQRLRRAGDGLRWRRAAVTTIAAKRPLLRKQPPLLLVACYSCFCWRIAAPHALSKNPPRLREAVLRGCHSTCYFIWPTYQPNHVLHKYVVFAWLVFFLLMVGFQFFYVVLLHQFTYRNRKVFSTKECCFYCIDVCQACIDCFGLVIPYANSSKCHQILCNNMFLIPCDKINRNITTHFIPQYLKYGFHVENPPGLLAS